MNGIPPSTASVVASASAASSSSSVSSPTLTPSASSFEFTREGEDHLQRLAAMAQGVGKDDSEPTITGGGSTSAEAASSLYPGYYHGYGWPSGYYNQFAQPLAPAAAAFSAWPAQCYASSWPNYANQSKKGRQTYQRYQTSVLESKFQQSSYVSKKQREELRLQTNLTDRQIKIWFQNRRMKAKKEKHRLDDGSEDSSLLPANPPPKSLLPPFPLGMAMHGIPVSASGSLEEEEKKWQLPSHLLSSHHMPSASWSATAAASASATAAGGGLPPYSLPYHLCPPNL